MSDDEDPFEKLDEEVEDREGDPFERLTEGVDDERPDDDAPASDLTPTDEQERPPQGSGPESEPEAPGERPDTQNGTDWIDEYGVGDDPRPDSDQSEQDNLEHGDTVPDQGTNTPDDEQTDSEMTFDVGIRDGAAQPDGLYDVGVREGDPFDQMGDTFEQMDTEGIDPDVVWEELTSAQSRESGVDSQTRTYAEVSKHAYCEACRYFTGPPEIECSHEGTEIIEFLDMETVRVVDCPIVAERRELEKDE